MSWLSLFWLVPLLPFLGAAANGIVGPRAPRAVHTAIGVGAPGLSLLLGLLSILEWNTTVRHLGSGVWEQVYYVWATNGLAAGEGGLRLDIGLMLDPLAATMLFVVTFVGFLIHVYSAGYMAHEAGYQRYFVYLNLFMGSMLLLVLGNNYLVTFVGWEGVGLCSYLLIGYYYDQDFPPYAGKKAFIVNRIGDFGFLVGLFALVATFGTLDYTDLYVDGAGGTGLVQAGAATLHEPYLLGLGLASFVALCLFIGAMGKSAQIPLYVWLPDAMAGPTPVSALIHAATMVTAGVFMVARSNVLYQLAPDISTFVAVIGTLTAIFAATIGLAQNDIKKVLAYSTVSQLGYMFLAAGVGAYSAAIFHVGTHAFFKALLFLGSGSVIHAMGGEQDMRRMGGLRRHLPITFWTFLIGTIAISGVPLFAGFFSKDAILAAAWESNKVLWAVGLLTAGLTACYMFRLVFMTFYGSFRGTHEQEHHLHESPRSMTVPLMILAVGAIFAGYAGKLPFTHRDWFGHFMAPVIAAIPGHEAHAGHHGLGLEAALVAASVLAAAIGIWMAYRTFGGSRGLAGGEAWAARFPSVHRLLEGKYFVDELYGRVVIRPLAWISKMFWKVVDELLIDGAIHVGAFVTELTGDLGRLTTTGNVRNYALFFFAGVLLLFAWMVL